MTRREAIKLAVAGALSPLLSLLPEREPTILVDPTLTMAHDWFLDLPMKQYNCKITEARQYDTLAETFKNVRPGETIFCRPLPVQKEAGK